MWYALWMRESRNKAAADRAVRGLIRAMHDGAFSGRGWQGATLVGALRGVTANDALWSPARGRRCIWEHVLHTAYWKHAIVRVLRGDEGEGGEGGEGGDDGFERSPSNWPGTPRDLRGAALERAWKADRRLLAAVHARLGAAVDDCDLSHLDRKPPGRTYSLQTYLVGIAAHDAYHLGQIQLIKRLMRIPG
jgi:hypothetical protein